MVTSSRALIVGWEEWVALPDLGLPAIKAKIDTGAKTSALHADPIELFGPAEAPMVRFTVHPIAGRSDVAVTAVAPVVDRREVTSSNGDRELRTVIKTRLDIGGEAWPIELTLTNRDAMSYRMLIGRQAVRDDMFVDPTSSFRQPRLSYKVYRPLQSRRPTSDSLRIALLTRKPLSPSNRRLAEAAEARGHTIDILDPVRLSFPLGAAGPLLENGRPLDPFDAVVPRIGPGPFGAAIVRHLEAGGAIAMNAADAIDRLRNPLAALQILAGAGLAVAIDTASDDGWSDAWRAAGRTLPRLAACIIGEDIAGVMRIESGGAVVAGEADRASISGPALRAARALGLRFARVDFSAGDGARTIVALSSAPDIAAFEKVIRHRLSSAIVDDLERRTRRRTAAANT
jgi:hypothetical protein